MPNYCPKGVKYMRQLARRGGLKSGETRRGKRAMRIIAQHAREKGIDPSLFLLPAPVIDAGMLERPNRSGGSHDTDWRCPGCHHFNSIKRRACAKCKAVAPANGRLTRAALRVRRAEHRIAGILGKDADDE